MASHYPQRRTTHQPRAFIRDKSFHSYNPLFLSLTIVAGGIAEIECTDSRKAAVTPSKDRRQTLTFHIEIRVEIRVEKYQ